MRSISGCVRLATCASTQDNTRKLQDARIRANHSGTKTAMPDRRIAAVLEAPGAGADTTVGDPHCGGIDPLCVRHRLRPVPRRW